MKSLEKRLQALEKRIRVSVIILEMPDGTTETIRMRDINGRAMLDLFCRAQREAQAGNLSREVDAIKRSVGWTEPNSGCLVNMIWALLNSPAGTAADDLSEGQEESHAEQ
jgi:hypothetical protein